MPSDNLSIINSWKSLTHTQARPHTPEYTNKMDTQRCANTQSECFWIETESDSDRIYCDGISKAAITALADCKAIRTHLSGSDQRSHPDTGPRC